MNRRGDQTARSLTDRLLFVSRALTAPQPVVDVPLSRAFTATWTAMEALVDKGKTRLIGQSATSSSPHLIHLLSYPKPKRTD